VRVPLANSLGNELSHYPRTKQSLWCSFILEAGEEAITGEGGWGGSGHRTHQGLCGGLQIREGDGQTWWAEIV
jgi:hypothetical protein